MPALSAALRAREPPVRRNYAVTACPEGPTALVSDERDGLVTPKPQLDLGFVLDSARRTAFIRRRVRYPYVLTGSFRHHDAPREVLTLILQSASGGIFASEQLAQVITLAPGCSLHLTTQAAAVVHRAARDARAELHTRLVVAERSCLEYLPEPFVLFPGSGLRQKIDVVVDRAGIAILSDGFVTHDPADAGGLFDGLELEFVAREWANAPPFCIERASISGVDFAAATTTGGRRYTAYGSIVAIAQRSADPHDLARQLTGSLAGLNGVYGAASALPEDRGVSIKLLARDGGLLRSAAKSACRMLRDILTGMVPAS
jgi:urease accessory protein